MKKENTLKIIYKKVNKDPKVMEIKNDLKTMQKLVDGLIEVVNYKDNVLLICNEERKINNLLPNLILGNDFIAGNCFFVKESEEGEFSSLVDEDIRKIKRDIQNRSFKYLEKDLESEL